MRVMHNLVKFGDGTGATMTTDNPYDSKTMSIDHGKNQSRGAQRVISFRSRPMTAPTIKFSDQKDDMKSA